MSSKGIVTMMCVLVFLIPGAYGFSVSIAGGQGGSSFSDTTTFSSQNIDSLSVNSIVNGAALEQFASGSGDLHKIFAASSRRGERAQITADVVNSGGWEYAQPAIYSDSTTASVTGFVLTAIDADTIKCNIGATDRRGDKASAAVEVYRGSLFKYQGDAFASSNRANAVQSFDAALGSQVVAREMASNPTGATVTNTNVQNGGIFGYNNHGLTFATPDFMETVGDFELAGGTKIGSESSAYKTCGYRSNTRMDVAGTETQIGIVSGYGSAAGVGFGFETGAEQILSGEAIGNTIGLSASSSNPRRDISILKTDILGTETEPGSISGYADLTESFKDSAFAANLFSQAGGDEIHLSSSASNRANDRARANMNVAGNGQITGYSGFTSATLETASANNNIAFGGTIAGERIEFDASTFDARRNNAVISTEVRDGSISDMLSNSADITLDELIAAQIANSVSGSSMLLKFHAREVLTGEIVDDRIEISNPSNFGYSIALTANKRAVIAI
jgi:hypothetical protein